MNATVAYAAPSDLEALLHGRLHDPFRFLGLHRDGAAWVLRVFRPHAEAVWLRLPGALKPLERVHSGGLFEWRGVQAPPAPYALGVSEGGHVHDCHDPYAYAPALSGHDLYLFNEGRLHQAWRTLGAHVEERNGVRGVRFAVWAPNAERVSVVGDFNRWDGRVHPMAVHGSSGVWELFIPELREGQLYKYEVRARDTGQVLVKTDPYAREFERRPGTAARVPADGRYVWQDGPW